MFALFYCLLDLRSGECNVVSLYVLCCPVNCLMKKFAICLGVFVIECDGVVVHVCAVSRRYIDDCNCDVYMGLVMETCAAIIHQKYFIQ